MKIGLLWRYLGVIVQVEELTITILQDLSNSLFCQTFAISTQSNVCLSHLGEIHWHRFTDAKFRGVRKLVMRKVPGQNIISTNTDGVQSCG